MATGEYVKILIVDDEVLIRQGVKHFMNWEQEGFQIVGEASNGEEALELIQRLRPHIVLTDIVMPVMDGEELTRQIKQQYPEIEIIILSSFGEFDYVRSTFQSGVADYILKPKLDIQHLLTVLKLTAERIPALAAGQSGVVQSAASGQEAKATRGGVYSPSVERLLERLMSGYEADAVTEEITALFPYALFRIAGIDTRGLPNGGAHEWSQLMESCKSLLPGAVIHELPEDGAIRACFINGDAASMERLEAAVADSLRRQSSERSQTPVAISAAFRDVRELRTCYRDSLLALLDYSFYVPDIPVLTKKEGLAVTPHTPVFHLDRFIDEFKRGRFQQAFEDLRKHVYELAESAAAEVIAFKSLLGNIVFNVTVLLGNMKYDIKELDKNKYAYFKAIEDARFAREALERLEAFIGEAEACIADKSAAHGSTNMKKLLDYIHEHYAEPLTLSDMARHFHFNPSYLSSYFSAHNSEGFVDYLHKVRIEKAEELLRQGDASIAQIGEMVGYSDHSYFTKVFKKLTGESPSRYRRQFTNEEKE
ncbi:response regulator transcription factor [Paenibacillus sp. PL2-23]|uniref:response regulator transcription factor n=1 Tax=Paenibacillus sp. PL2-23 TaxID=2100729 RepID=UPI0030F6AD38